MTTKNLILAIACLVVSGAAAATPSAAKQGAVPSALAALAKKEDKIDGITWYRDKSSPQHQNSNAAFLYIGKPAVGPSWLRLTIRYEADDWLFIQTATIVVDGVKQGVVGGRWLRDHARGRVWEWSDTAIKPEQIKMFSAMANAKAVVIRYEGSKYTVDRAVKAQELAAMRQVLKAYAELGGALK